MSSGQAAVVARAAEASRRDTERFWATHRRMQAERQRRLGSVALADVQAADTAARQSEASRRRHQQAIAQQRLVESEARSRELQQAARRTQDIDRRVREYLDRAAADRRRVVARTDERIRIAARRAREAACTRAAVERAATEFAPGAIDARLERAARLLYWYPYQFDWVRDDDGPVAAG